MIVGPTCSGKSTVAARLSAAMGVRCIEMDDMVWSPRWVRVDKAGAAGRRAFRERCAAAVSDEAWVCAGAWSSGRDLVLARAETVVSLDLGLWCIFVRMLGRTAWRCWSQQPVCNGNYETLASAAFGAHSKSGSASTAQLILSAPHAKSVKRMCCRNASGSGLPEAAPLLAPYGA